MSRSTAAAAAAPTRGRRPAQTHGGAPAASWRRRPPPPTGARRSLVQADIAGVLDILMLVEGCYAMVVPLGAREDAAGTCVLLSCGWIAAEWSSSVSEEEVIN